MNKLCFLFAKKIAIDNKQTRWKSAESFSGSLGLSEWHWELSRNGAKTAIFHEGFIDLSLEMSEIKSRFRKSYKSLINWGLANWQSGILDIKGNFSVWEEFRNLHISVSGRETRSFKTWEMQYEDIKSGKSFLVWLRDKSSTLVGGGYFDVTRDEGLYDCGAYDRELFSMPLGHVVQFLAIQELKKRGCRFYKIGRLPHKYEEPTPTDKEISIGEFKKGFSLEIFPKYVYEIDTII
jgi:FemAB family protein